MKFGMSVAPFGDFGTPQALAELAKQAEDAGWDGFFIWDHMMFDPSFHPNVDPWIGLTAVALRTSHIRLGTMITPLPRRRPWKVARETVSLDQVSNGRFILGVGLGDPSQWDYGFFGEETDAKIRAEKLDESLEIITGLWRGEPFRYEGKHFQIKEEVLFLPRPVQNPRIPIWVGGWWPNKPPMRRAARWDGAIPIRDGGIPAEDWPAIKEYIRKHREADDHFEYVHCGASPGDNPEEAKRVVLPYVEAGVDWWIEGIDPWRFGWSYEDQWAPEASVQMRERVLQGPPR